MSEAKNLSDEKRRQHIRELEAKVKAYGGTYKYYGGLSLEEQEKFLERVIFFEETEEQPLYDLLENSGVGIPSPENLDDAGLHAKLWEVIRAMALMGHYLSSTDHLSDRQLYELLFKEILREPTTVCPDPATSCHIDILGGCSDEDLRIRLQYYADEDERLSWEGELEDEIPPKTPLPFDRDRFLPAPSHELQEIC